MDIILVLHLLAGIIGSLFLCLVQANEQYNVYTLVSVILQIIYMYKKHFAIFKKYLFFMINALGVTLSIYVLDTYNIPLPELARVTEYNGSLFAYALVIYCAIFIIYCYEYFIVNNYSKTDNSEEIKPDSIHSFIIYLISILAVIYTLYICLFAVTHPFFLYQYDRIDYLKIVANPLVRQWQKLYFIIPISIMAAKMGYRTLLFAQFLLLIIFLILSGHKYGAYVNLYYIYCLSTMDRYVLFQMPGVWLKLFFNKFTMAAAFMVIIGFNYYVLSSNNAIESFMIRIAEQGQLWWSTYGNYKNSSMHLSELKDETYAMLKAENLDTYDNFGIYKIMWKSAPTDIVKAYLVKGVRFTEATLSSLFYYFHNFGFILYLLLVPLYCFLVNKLIFSINHFQILDTLLYYRVLVEFFQLFIMAGYNRFISYKIILCVVALCILHYGRNIAGKYGYGAANIS